LIGPRDITRSPTRNASPTATAAWARSEPAKEFGRAPKPYRSRGSKKGKRATYNLRSGGYVYKGSKPRPYVGLKNRDHAIAKIQLSAPPTIWRHLLDAWNARGGE
jgi:hypothetical protein